MSFWHKTSRGYMDEVDIEGTLKVLSDRIVEDPQGAATPYYVGAHLLLNLMYNHNDIRDQSVLMKLFDMQLINEEII